MSLKPWNAQAQAEVMSSANDARKTQLDGITETLMQFWNPTSIILMVGISGITGLLGGVLAFFIALAFELPKSWWYLFIGGTFSTLIMWGLILFVFFFKLIFPQLKFMIGVDLNHNGIPDKYEQAVSVLQMNYVDQDGNYTGKMQKFEIPASPEQLRELAIGTFNLKRPFALREWAGSGKPFSDLQFRKLQDTFANDHYKFIILKNDASPNQGYMWTHKGLAALQQYLPETHAGAEV